MGILMRRSALFVSLFALACALTLPLSAQQKFKVSALSVPVYVTVWDQQRHLVPDLVQDDFEILDNSKLQTISVFENKPTPITAIVMLDTSGSMTGSIDLVKEGAEQFMIRLLPSDQAQLGAFNDKIEFHPASSFTGSRDQLVAALKDIDFGNGTRLYDAVDESVTRLENVDGRKVAVVFTDGDDTESKIGAGKVMDHARAKDVMLYGIGLVNEYFDGQHRVKTQPDKSLRRFAEDSGGGYFELKRTADLGETFTRVAQELHSQYVLGFSPEALDGKVHKLDVRVKKPGMIARARKTYLAAAGS
jgi:Ca-activated chloride channel homolog